MSANFATGLGMYFLRAGLLLACFWIVYGFLRSNPRARVMLCRIVSVAMALLPLLNFLPLPALFSLPAFIHPHVETASAPITPVLPAPESIPPAPVSVADDYLPPIDNRPPTVYKPFVPPAAPASARVWKFTQWHLPGPGALAAIWLAAAGLLLARWGIALFAARRLAAVAQPPPDWVRESADRFRALLGIRGRVGIGVAGKVCSPLLIGPRAVILLPSHLVSEDSAGDLRAALAHELVHVRRADWHWSQWLHLVTILAWPLPPVWFLRRAHDAASELVCDHIAAASVGGAAPYAGALARQSLHAIGHPNPATVPMLRKPGIRRRIDLLLSGVKLPSLSWRATIGAAILTLLAAGLLGSLQLARAAGNAAKNESPAPQDAEIKKEVNAFAPRLNNATDLGPEKYDSEMRSIRAALDKVPQPERTWVALWLNNTEPRTLRPDWWHHELPRPLYSDEELVEMCRKIGPDALMKVLKAQRFPGAGPDFQNLTRGGFVDTAWFILDHAVELLRPQDSGALLTLNSGKNKSQAWLIAAARLQPAKALGILRPAYAEFTGPVSQAKLTVALWQTCGESQTSFIVDKFYELAQLKGNFPDGAGGIFIEEVSAIEKPSARKLIATILQDKRLDDIKMDWLTFLRLAQAINGWAKKPVLSGPEISGFAQTFVDHKEDVPANIQARKQLLDRLRDSVPEWSDASPAGTDAGPAKSASPAPQNADIQKEFETLAGESSYFEIDNVLYYGRSSAGVPGGTAEENAKYAAFIARLRSIHADKDKLIPLLKNKDPKVRTLAIAALANMDDPTVLPFIADLLGDEAITFSRLGWGPRPQQGDAPVIVRPGVTVGDNALEVLFLYLGQAGYTGYRTLDDRTQMQRTRKEFDDYWSRHKGRDYCMSWFAVRLERLVNDTPVPDAAAPYDTVRHLIRADLEKIPQPDRTWTALRLNCEFANTLNFDFGRSLYSQEELLDMCRKLGPETLMNALKQHRFPSDDPDIQRGNTNYVNGYDFLTSAEFILGNAGALLRPQDTDVLVTLNSGKTMTPSWFIAAARLQPAKAVEILRAAYSQFPGSTSENENYRVALDIALWRLGGESQTSFLTDQFYDTMAFASVSHNGYDSYLGEEFIDPIAKTEQPPGTKLIAAILQDKRMDDLKICAMTLADIARAVNGWAKKPIISDAETKEAYQVKGTSYGPAYRLLKKEQIQRLRDSVPEWINADPGATDTAPVKGVSPAAQNADVQKEFETIAGEFPCFDMRDAYEKRTGYTPAIADDFPKYEAFMGHFFSIHAGKDELIPLLKHKDPKVRTMAIAALVSLEDPAVLPLIADLLSDGAATFSRPGAPKTGVTVGEEARQALSFYLRPAGYSGEISRKEFDDYWTRHKDRAWCASWFEVRLDKTSDLALGREQCAAIIRSIRADLEKVPQPDRTWLALWLNNNQLMYKLPPNLPDAGYHNDPLYSDTELVDLCREIGPDALMKALKERRFTGDDPDVQYGDNGTLKSFNVTAFRFILENADSLLRPQDSDALLAMNSGKNASPWWFIAAAKVQPAKTVEILRSAFTQFTNADSQLDLCVALWQVCGESQTAFIVDKFYEIVEAKPGLTGSAGLQYSFIPEIVRIEKPPGRKLIAAIIQDKRADDLEKSFANAWILVNIARTINDRAKKPVVSDAEIGKALNSKENTPAIMQMRKELLDRLRDSAPEWSNADPAGANTGPVQSATPAAQNTDVQKEFETLAGKSSYFEIHDVIYEVNKRLDFKDGMFSVHDAKYPAFISRLLSIQAGRDELIALLKHPDPKVRTLAIAALVSRDDPTVLPFIADLLSDDAITFSREVPGGDPSTHPLRNDVTVAENAREVLFLYLYQAGYSSSPRDLTREDFDAYWSRHKVRNYCGSWFDVRLQRTLYSGDEAYAGAKSSVRADIDKIPMPDRAWIALGVYSGQRGGAQGLYSEEELLDMFKKLGPEAVINAVKQRQFPGDDPDIQFGKGAPFILSHASELLRPEDAGTLATLAAGENSSPWWFIAAAQLNPAKAVEILRSAYAHFQGGYPDHESERMTLDIALWKSGGESQIPFLVDRFYADALNPDLSRPKWGAQFILQIAAMEKPPGRKLIAAILQDKRLDDLKVGEMHFYFTLMARAINGWAKKTVISENDPYVAKVGSEFQTGNPADDPLKMNLLHRMRDSAPEWSNADPAGAEAVPAQTTDVKKEFETLAGESSYFEINDVIYERQGFTDHGSADDNKKYDAFMRRFLSVRAGREELVPLLKHDNPKVRTLALAALLNLDDPTALPFIAGLQDDKALTFSREGTLPQLASAPAGPPRTDVTVGENARAVLRLYLRIPPDYTGRQDISAQWNAYWSTHKGRAYSAGWFATRLRRASYSGPGPNGESPYDKARRLARADLDKVPQPDRTWIALWLDHISGGALYSKAELLDMCRKLGPEALMGALKQQRFPCDDPDIQFAGANANFTDIAGFILRNAGELLRPQDADVLISLNSGKNPSPSWFIAAARIQPARAGEILQHACAQFNDADGQFRLLDALWELGGESQTPFIVDKFYGIAQASNDSSGTASGNEFIGWIIEIKTPPGRKLIAAILQDKRADALQTHGVAVIQIARAVNVWSGKPVVSDSELAGAAKGMPAKTAQPLPPDLPLRLELLHRMRDSAPQWSN